MLCVCVCVSPVSVLFSVSLLSLPGDPTGTSTPSTPTVLCVCCLLDSIDQHVKATWRGRHRERERVWGREDEEWHLCAHICFSVYVGLYLCAWSDVWGITLDLKFIILTFEPVICCYASVSLEKSSAKIYSQGIIVLRTISLTFQTNVLQGYTVVEHT